MGLDQSSVQSTQGPTGLDNERERIVNSELKALIKMAIDLYSTGKAVISKSDFVTGILPALYKVTTDIPGVAAGIGNIQAELTALKSAEADVDLVAYVVASVDGVTADEHAKAVLSAVLVAIEHVVQDILSIKSAIEAPAAPASA